MLNRPPTSSSADTDGSKGWGAGVCTGLAILAIALSTTLGVLATGSMQLLGREGEIAETSVRLLPLAVSQLGFFLIGHLYARRYRTPVSIRFPTRDDIDYAVVGTLAALGFAAGALAVVEATETVPAAPTEEPVLREPMAVLWMIVLAAFVIAPAEEYLFRGVIQRRLRERFGAPGAILGASLLFGSLHAGNFSGSLETVLMGVLLISGVGVGYGFLYERTGMLVVPIAGHALYNVVLYGGSYLAA